MLCNGAFHLFVRPWHLDLAIPTCWLWAALTTMKSLQPLTLLMDVDYWTPKTVSNCVILLFCVILRLLDIIQQLSKLFNWFPYPLKDPPPVRSVTYKIIKQDYLFIEITCVSFIQRLTTGLLQLSLAAKIEKFLLKETLHNYCKFCCRCTLHPQHSILDLNGSHSFPVSVKQCPLNWLAPAKMEPFMAIPSELIQSLKKF